VALVIETHIAVSSPQPVEDVIHLQMSVKLRRTEIDAITCESKQAIERVLESQIVEQVKAAFAEKEFDFVIPIAIRAVKKTGIYVVEFELVARANASIWGKPKLAVEALYVLKPPVKGI
jgi:hypothetical protein